MSNVITKHKDLSERFVTPELNKLLQAARNLYLYGVEKEELFAAIRKEINELDDAGIPLASPRSEGAEVSDAEPEVGDGDGQAEPSTEEGSDV